MLLPPAAVGPDVGQLPLPGRHLARRTGLARAADRQNRDPGRLEVGVDGDGESPLPPLHADGARGARQRLHLVAHGGEPDHRGHLVLLRTGPQLLLADTLLRVPLAGHRRVLVPVLAFVWVRRGQLGLPGLGVGGGLEDALVGHHALLLGWRGRRRLLEVGRTLLAAGRAAPGRLLAPGALPLALVGGGRVVVEGQGREAEAAVLGDLQCRELVLEAHGLAEEREGGDLPQLLPVQLRPDGLDCQVGPHRGGGDGRLQLRRRDRLRLHGCGRLRLLLGGLLLAAFGLRLCWYLLSRRLLLRDGLRRPVEGEGDAVMREVLPVQRQLYGDLHADEAAVGVRRGRRRRCGVLCAAGPAGPAGGLLLLLLRPARLYRRVSKLPGLGREVRHRERHLPRGEVETRWQLSPLPA
mmetsp:Transcript_105943/g.287555  ORF Transcript_105943/g.287555 Transcript_105943/m.287555 type:complete len:409 (-) Transcript_105943:1775-3001(-)